MKFVVTHATQNTREARDKTQSRPDRMTTRRHPLDGRVGRTPGSPNVNITKGFSDASLISPRQGGHRRTRYALKL
jgi:hypothetical protein